ncbi:MAG: hypothetical protein ACRCXT_24245 [Paraclostridium sp.]
MSCFVNMKERVKVRIVGRPGKSTCITHGGILLPAYPFYACKADVLNFLNETLTVEQIADNSNEKIGDITKENINTIFGKFRVSLTLSKNISSVSYKTLTYAVVVKDIDGKEITEGVTEKLVLTSSDTKVATVGSGIITLVKPGKVTIKCTYDGEFEGVANLLVTDAYDVTVTTGLVSLKVGGAPVTFDYNELSGSLNSDAFEVTVENPEYAQISVDKPARRVTVTPVAEGSTSVVVKIKDTTVTESVTVNVAAADPVVVAEEANVLTERKKK